MVESLNSPDITKILNELMGGTATILEKSYVQIYTAEAEKKQRYQGSNISGICYLVFDRRQGKVPYLRVYDAANLETLFSIELFYGFMDSWTKFTQFLFYSFLPRIYRFLFPNANEAQKMTIKIGTASPKYEHYEKILTERRRLLDEQKLQDKQQKEKVSVFEKIKKGVGEKEEEQKFQMSGPTGFAHTSSMKINPSTGQVNLENLNADYVKMFNGMSQKKPPQN